MFKLLSQFYILFTIQYFYAGVTIVLCMRDQNHNFSNYAQNDLQVIVKVHHNYRWVLISKQHKNAPNITKILVGLKTLHDSHGHHSLSLYGKKQLSHSDINHLFCVPQLFRFQRTWTCAPLNMLNLDLSVKLSHMQWETLIGLYGNFTSGFFWKKAPTVNTKGCRNRHEHLVFVISRSPRAIIENFSCNSGLPPSSVPVGYCFTVLVHGYKQSPEQMASPTTSCNHVRSICSYSISLPA